MKKPRIDRRSPAVGFSPGIIMMSGDKVVPLKTKATSSFKIVARGKDAAEIYIYGAIGESFWGEAVSDKQFADELKKHKNAKNIDVRINSEGGDVFHGKAIYTLLRNHGAKITVHVDGLAASAASYIAMAGDEIRMSEGAFMMIHNAWSFSIGNAAEMRRVADLLDSVSGSITDVYVARTKQPRDTVQKWMDDETWFTAEEAKANGFADTIVENLKVAACIAEPHRFKNTPKSLFPRRVAAAAAIAAMKSRA